MFWGDRFGKLSDPFGHHWAMATHKEDVSPAEMDKRGQAFFAQMQNGAPFDVFLSADIDYPRRLASSGQAERASLYTYARGHLVLWTRTDSGIDIRRGLPVVLERSVRRIAIANPEHAPYGRAAVAALRHERLYDGAQAKFVLGENISQAAQFAQSGSTDVGVLALSLALSPTPRAPAATSISPGPVSADRAGGCHHLVTAETAGTPISTI
jgi:molybdate transport system substrate-binding protein